MWLGFCVAVAVVWAGSCSSNLTLAREPPDAAGAALKKKKKKKDLKTKTEALIPSPACKNVTHQHSACCLTAGFVAVSGDRGLLRLRY